MNPLISIVDDDESVRTALKSLIDSVGFRAEVFCSGEEFLKSPYLSRTDCLIADVRMPGMSGLELVRRLREQGLDFPVIVMTGHADVPLAVEAMKAGAVEFLEKPFEEEVLLRAVQIALRGGPPGQDPTEKKRLRAIFEALSPREQQVLDGVVAGKLNKVIAFELGISPRTVEVYRANMMSKTGAHGLSELVQMVMHARL